MANGESNKHSQLGVEQDTRVLREQGTTHLLGKEELILVPDGMELRRRGRPAQSKTLPRDAGGGYGYDLLHTDRKMFPDPSW